MKTKGFRKGAAIGGLCFFLLVFVMAFLPVAKAWAKETIPTPTETYTITPGEFDNYTDSSYLYDLDTDSTGTDSIYNYPNHLKSLYEAEEAVEDEWILQTIPEKLFLYPGEYFYVGKKYGFYLKYEAENDRYFYYLLKTEIKDGNNDIDLPGGQFKIRVEPLAYNYCVFNRDTGKTQPCLINGSYNYMTVRELYLKDVGMTAQLHNKYHPNQTQSSYDPQEDDGQFFIGTDYRLSGTTLADPTKYSVKSAKYIFGLLGLTCPEINIFSTLLVTVWNIAEDIPEFIQAVQKDYREDIVLGASNLYLDMDAISKPNQLKEYGGLQKIAASGVETSAKEPVLLSPLRGENYAETIFYINETEPWESLFMANISLDIVDEFGMEARDIVSDAVSTPFQYHYRKGEEALRTLNVNQEETNYGLTDQKDGYIYTPDHTGEHTLSFCGEEGTEARATVKDGEQVIYRQTEYSQSFQIDDLDLTAGRQYTVEMDMRSEKFSTCYRLGMDFTPPHLSIGDTAVSVSNSDHRYLTFQGSGHLYYRFTVSDPDALLEVYGRGFGLIERSEGNTVVLPLLGDVPYYIKVVFPASVSKDVTVSVVDERHVAFDCTGGEPIAGITVSSGVPFTLPTPVRSGYEFVGWRTELADTIVKESDVYLMDTPDILLKAVWSAIPYTISYVANGGTLVPDLVYTVDKGAVLDTSVTKEGYTFLGWYDNALFTGDPITRLQVGETGNKVFYAKWVKTDHVISLDVNSAFTDGIAAAIDSTQASVQYGQSYTLPVPRIKGFSFQGWYLGGKKYADSEGICLANYSDSESVTLIAKWTRDRYYIQIDLDGTLRWLSSDDLNVEECFVEYEQGFCPCCWIKYRVPLVKYYKEGHVFEGLLTVQDDPASIACWNITEKDIANGQVLTLYAYYTREVNFKVDFYSYAEAELPSIEASYNDSIVLPRPQKTGYTFREWRVADYEKNAGYAGTHFAIGALFSYDKMPDLSVDRQESGCTIYLEAVFTPNTYTVTLQEEGAARTMQAVFDSYLSGAYVPTKSGYTFAGWYTERDGGGRAVLDGRGASLGVWNIAYDVTLYPKWNANTYLVTYYDGSQIYYQSVVYNETVTLKNLSRYYYNGYWNILGEKLAMGSAYRYTYPGDVRADAVWEGYKYNIYYKNLSSGTQTARLIAPSEYEYGTGLDLQGINPEFTHDHYTTTPYSFLGWYTNMSFSTQKTSISSTSTGDVTLYAKWEYKDNVYRYSTYTITDASQFNQDYDVLYLNFKSYDTFNAMKTMGFKNVVISFNLDIWEVDDGYQDIYVYDSPDSNARIVWKTTIEHGPGKKLTTYSTYHFEFTVSIDTLRGLDYLYLRFGAHGNYADTWRNNNLRLTIRYVA